VQKLGGASALDGVATRIGKAVRDAVQPGAVRDALSGRALGHAIHPLLTDIPIGTWTSASLLDAIGGPDADRAARRLIAVGIAAALPTAATGLLDWSDTEPVDDEVRRVGLVHAASNVAALSLYSASLAARRRGARGRGRLLGLAGAGALAVGGQLGGHLSFAKAVGVDATALGPALDDWTDAGSAGDLQEGVAACRDVAGVAVLLVRRGGEVYALADRCAHRGGPLHEGEIDDGCVTCPLHGSRFRLADGSVQRGPSPYPQPTFEVRETGGRLEVRSAHGAPTL
jgi:nitrite reductase/ring-hydroxylating ferredoxin subunit